MEFFGTGQVAECSVHAVITRKDGTVEDLGCIARGEFDENGEQIPSKAIPALSFSAPGEGPWYRKLGRVLKGLLPIAVLVVAAAAGGGFAATLIVNGGHAIVTNRIIGSGTEPKFVAWGTGAGTTAAGDTTLFTESSEESRTSGTSSRVTTTVTNDTYQVVGTITVVTSNKTITNVGLFDASTSGNLYFKSDFTGLALLIGDSITFTIKVKYS